MINRDKFKKALQEMRDNLHDDMKDYYTSGEIDKAYLSIHRYTQKFVEEIILPEINKE